MNELAIYLNNTLPAFSSQTDNLEEELSSYFNTLIAEDFDLLIHYLYRFDINEGKIRNLLQAREEKPAGQIIAKLVIDRCQEKIESRKRYRPDDPDCKEERW